MSKNIKLSFLYTQAFAIAAVALVCYPSTSITNRMEKAMIRNEAKRDRIEYP